MFSAVSVIMFKGRGSHVTIIRDTLDLTVEGPISDSVQLVLTKQYLLLKFIFCFEYTF